jgi:hypothetical protein
MKPAPSRTAAVLIGSHVGLVLGVALAVIQSGWAGPAAAPALAPFPAEGMDFLRGLSRDVVQAARVRPGEGRSGSVSNSVGFTLIMPGGNYPAYWIRDFAMSLESGCVTAEEMLNHLRLTARAQNGAAARRLANGLMIPPFAIPDHILFNGGAVFYPGTYSTGRDQGSGAYGILPPVDDHYEFVHIAYCYFRASTSTNFLEEPINGLTLIERLVAAFDAPRTDPQTGLVETDTAQRAVGFGFCDTVTLTGKMLFPSLLRYRAAGQLAELHRALSRGAQAETYRQVQQKIAQNLAPVFSDPARLRGWLKAATGIGGQADVWGTLYALHLGVLAGPAADQAAETVLEAVRQGSIVYEAGVRHVPTNLDFSASSAWEKTAGVALNTYQNGAYWHTPTGWLIAVVARRDRTLGLGLFAQYLEHLRKVDYRLGGGRQGPWECFGPKGYAQNGVYMASVALPLAVLSDHRASR